MKNGWQERQLGTLAELKGRIGWRGLTAKEYTKSGPLFLSVHSLNYGDYVDFRDAFHISEARYDESPEIMLQENDVLICKDGAGIGKVGIVGALPDKATINSSLLLIRSGDAILPKFLYRCLSSPYFQEIVASRLNGATTPHLYQRDITEFPVFLPPLAEQRRIVDILDEAFAGIAAAKANAEKNLQNARNLFDSCVHAVFAEQDRNWSQKSIAELCVIGDGNHSSNYPKKNELVAAGVPFIRATNLVAGRISDVDMRFLSEAKHAQLKKGHLKTGDILFTNRGEIGKTAIVDSAHDNANLNSQIAWLRCRDSVDNRFLFHLLNSSEMQRRFQSSKSGAALQQFTIRQLKELKVPTPPIETQRALANKLDSVEVETDRVASVYQRKLAALDELKKSLLHQAFSGQL